MNKFLICFAAFVCAAYGYSIPKYGVPAPVLAGAAYQIEPATTLQIIPLPSYGKAPGYGPVPAYAPAPAPVYSPAPSPVYGSSAGAIDSEVLKLAKLALYLPSAGGPILSSGYGSPVYSVPAPAPIYAPSPVYSAPAPAPAYAPSPVYSAPAPAPAQSSSAAAAASWIGGVPAPAGSVYGVPASLY